MNDPFVSCPYDKVHQVPRSRLQAHIVKCEVRYPKLEICPYNATHRVPKNEIKEHITICPSRKEILAVDDMPPKHGGDILTPKPIPFKSFRKETDPNHEMWDD